MRRIFAAFVLAVSLLAVILAGSFASAGGKCSPGQQGNPHPGFKPGVCLLKR